MISGIINLKKEAGMTSHDAVFKLRRILKEKKIGHAGTLDPDVIGVLPIAVGKATRVIEYMTETGKVYEGEITLGYSTTTEDSSGEIVKKVPVDQNLTEDMVDVAMSCFLGDISQTPPMYSAVKVKGKKLYEYARMGQVIDRPTRIVHIKEFIRTSSLKRHQELVSFDFKVVCGKGTYVRTLSVDLGEKLGYPSHMSSLVRTMSAGLELSDAYTISDIKELFSQGRVDFLLPLESGLSDLKKIELTEEQVNDVRHGRFIQIPSNSLIVAAFYKGKAVAIMEKREQMYKPRKVLLP